MRRIVALCGRALVGAFTGFAVMGVILLVASNNFGLGSRADTADDQADLARTVVLLVGGATVAGAVVVSLFGTVQLGGRMGSALGGMAFGGLTGVLAGSTLGPVLCSMMGMPMPSKAGVALGIFVGLPLGVIFGGVIGAALPQVPGEKGPVRADDGVRDRTLDA